MNISMNFPRPTKPYARKPKHPSNAKITTLIWEAFTFLSEPNLVASHSAPVVALDLRNHLDKYIIRKTWLKTGHSQGIQILFIPYIKQSATIHMVPLMSNISDASLRPRSHQGRDFPPIR